jgi:solute carrier family 25 (mitochondrial S-adenosylmethionine transporter), member 26
MVMAKHDARIGRHGAALAVSILVLDCCWRTSIILVQSLSTLKSETVDAVGHLSMVNDRSSAQSAMCSRSHFLSVLGSASLATGGHLPKKARASVLQPTPTSTKPYRGQKHEKTVTWQESVSGLVAGGVLTCAKTLVKYPLDTVTVRLQVPVASGDGLTSGYSRARRYNIMNPRDWSPLFSGSYRGVIIPLVTNIPAGAVFFAVKDATLSTLGNSAVMSSWLRTCLAVSAAQIPYWLVRNPSEVVKTRQQAGAEGYGDGVSAWEAFLRARNNNSSENILETDYYNGYWENIFYALPADVLKFVVYDYLSNGRRKSELSALDSAVLGAVSTAIAQLLTTPLDVIRNRVMAKTGQREIIMESRGLPTEASSTTPVETTDATRTMQKASYIEALLQLGREEGMAGLFAGATPRVGKALLSGAIQFATYEETKLQFAKFFAGRSS